MKKIKLILVALICHFSTFAQTIEPFKLKDVVSKQDISLSDYNSSKAIVIIFMSGKCAYTNYYLPRIKTLEQKYNSKNIKFILINSNKSAYVPEESVESMGSFAQKNNITFPYLADKNQTAQNILGATRTPEVFILIPKASKFEVIYSGAIDDNPQSPSDVSHAYVDGVLVNLLANKNTGVTEVRPIGCLIK